MVGARQEERPRWERGRRRRAHGGHTAHSSVRQRAAASAHAHRAAATFTTPARFPPGLPAA